MFAEELEYFTQPLALDVELDVRAAPSHTIADVLGTRLWEDRGADGGVVYIPGVFLTSRSGDEPGETGRRGGGSSLYIAMDRLRSGDFEGEAMATVSVQYRLPGTDEVVTQSIVVDNPFQDEVPDAGYVSHLEMLKAYAVYNVFLGLHKAASLAENDYNCALETVRALRLETQAWIAHSPSDDLSADVELLASFAQNLEALGARGELCGVADDSGYGEEYQDDYYYERRGCSAGGSSSGLAGAGLLLMLFGVFRRRVTTLR